MCVPLHTCGGQENAQELGFSLQGSREQTHMSLSLLRHLDSLLFYVCFVFVFVAASLCTMQADPRLVVLLPQPPCTEVTKIHYPAFLGC